MNPAKRLLTIYDSLLQQPNDQTMLQVWVRIFELDESSPHLDDDASTCLIALRQEINLVRGRLNDYSVPLELTSPGFDHLKHTALPANLSVSWNSVRGNIQPPECRLAFMWSSWVLRDEEEADIPEEDTISLRAEIESLKQSLRETEMSQYLRNFIERQIDVIGSALQIYRVKGAQSLKEALHGVAGAYTLERAQVEAEHRKAPSTAKNVFSRAISVINKTAEVCDSVDKIKKAGEGAITLAKTVGPLMAGYLIN